MLAPSPPGGGIGSGPGGAASQEGTASPLLLPAASLGLFGKSLYRYPGKVQAGLVFHLRRVPCVVVPFTVDQYSTLDAVGRHQQAAFYAIQIAVGAFPVRGQERHILAYMGQEVLILRGGELDDLQDSINENGCSDEYKNGENQYP